MNIKPSRFAMRSPAPDYRPESRWPTLLLFAVVIVMLILGAAVEGYGQEETPIYSGSVSSTTLVSPAPKNLVITAGTGKIVITFETGKVEVIGVTIDEASRQFWVSVAKAFPESREAMQRKYTVNEIDALRRACWTRCAFGTTYFAPEPHDPARELKDKDGVIRGYTMIAHTGLRSFSPGELDRLTEEQVRTAMLAGQTAKDIYEADAPKEKAP